MQIIGVSDRGRVRERNEDSLAVDEALGVAVVADGMGGLEAGEVASREAVAAVIEHLRAAARPQDAGCLETALAVANGRVREVARSGGVVMGTTAVALAAAAERCRIAHVGDSRGYRFHSGTLSLLTRDHSLVQDMVERGVLTAEAARRSTSRHVITRALGLDDAVEPDAVETDLDPGDLLLLCSDGLWDMLDDDRIAAVLAGCGPCREGLQACARALVDAANAAGGIDNVSVVLARA